jgi:hypothetical protein
VDDRVGRWENVEDEDGRLGCSEERVGPGEGDVSESSGAFPEVEGAVRASWPSPTNSGNGSLGLSSRNRRRAAS